MLRVLDDPKEGFEWVLVVVLTVMLPFTTIVGCEAAYEVGMRHSLPIAIYATMAMAFIGMSKIVGAGCYANATEPSVKRWGFAVAIVGAALTCLAASYRMVHSGMATATGKDLLDKALGWPSGTSLVVLTIMGILTIEIGCLTIPFSFLRDRFRGVRNFV
jgi:hypothetical protein